MLSNHGRGPIRTLFTRPALVLGRLGVTPNMFTVTGAALSMAAAVILLPRGYLVAGSLVLLVILVANSFDGILARATGKSPVFGASLDSTMDHLADGATLGSLAVWAALSIPIDALRTVTVTAALVAVVMAATIPYAHVRAESIGATTFVGIVKHTDWFLVALGPTFLVGLGVPQQVLTARLVYVVIVSFIAAIQRVRAVHRQIRQGDKKA